MDYVWNIQYRYDISSNESAYKQWMSNSRLIRCVLYPLREPAAYFISFSFQCCCIALSCDLSVNHTIFWEKNCIRIKQVTYKIQVTDRWFSLNLKSFWFQFFLQWTKNTTLRFWKLFLWFILYFTIILLKLVKPATNNNLIKQKWVLRVVPGRISDD